MYYNGDVCSLWGSTLPKVRITSKKASNKSCSKLNFAQKSPRAYTSISPMSGARGLQRSVCLKSYNVQKPKLDSLCGLMLPKISILRKKLWIKVVRNRILYKKVRERVCPSSPWVTLCFGYHFERFSLKFPENFLSHFRIYWSTLNKNFTQIFSEIRIKIHTTWVKYASHFSNCS